MFRYACPDSSTPNSPPSSLIHCLLVYTLPFTTRARVCMVGDRLDTDILFGNDNGLKSCLVLSGVTTEEKLLSKENQVTPNYYCDDITAFFKA